MKRASGTNTLALYTDRYILELVPARETDGISHGPTFPDTISSHGRYTFFTFGHLSRASVSTGLLPLSAPLTSLLVKGTSAQRDQSGGSQEVVRRYKDVLVSQEVVRR